MSTFKSYYYIINNGLEGFNVRLRINPKKTYNSPIAMKLKIKLHSTSRIPFSLKKSVCNI